MALGIICGFLAALFNSIGYLFSARFLLHHKSPFLLLILAQCGMLLVSFPFLFWLFPFGSVDRPWWITGLTVAWVAVFMIGQGTFFTALRYFEALPPCEHSAWELSTVNCPLSTAKSWKSWLPLLEVSAKRITHLPGYWRKGVTLSSPM